MIDLTVDVIAQLAQLVVTHKLDCLKVGDLVISKSKHETPKLELNKASAQELNMIDEELLYYSSKAPKLSPEELTLGLTPPGKR